MIETVEIAPKSTEIRVNWDNARLYCFALRIDGKTGWRLPTMEELFTIYQALNDFEKSWYWSSSEFDTGRVWIQSFHSAGQYYYKKGYHTGCVRAVRDLKAD